MMEIENKKSLFQVQLDELLVKEKEARQANESQHSVEILTQIAQKAFDMKEYNVLFEQLLSLTKKRGQSKKAIIEMVQLSMKFINLIDDKDTKLRLIQTLKEVCDKKIFVEVEYARCCLMMVKLNENQNNIDEAAKIMQEVQVETYGSMDKREKLEFILYQMRIMIKKNDFVRLFIISKKINKKSIEEAELQDLKILFYLYLTIYYNHENKFMESMECYKQVFDTLQSNPSLEQKVQEFSLNTFASKNFENFVMYLIISGHSLQQTQLLQKLKNEYLLQLEKDSNLLHLVNSIMSTELISTNVASYNFSNAELFLSDRENHDVNLRSFRKQLVCHNLRIISLYYEQIYLKRMSELLQIDQEEVEQELCEMINSSLLYAKINRVDGTVKFKALKNENEVLNEWAFDLHKVLNLVDQTCNLIKRENELQA